MPFFRSSLGGKGYVVLNVLRSCNIICLLAAAVAALLMMGKTQRTTSFWFFDGASYLLAAVVCTALAITELPLVQRWKRLREYIVQDWPLFSQSSGLLTLGIFMIAIGISTLGCLNKESCSRDNLAFPMWSCVVAAGIINFVFGFFNISMNYAFQFQTQGISARQTRTYGATASLKSTPTGSTSTSRTISIKGPPMPTRRARASAFLRRYYPSTAMANSLSSYGTHEPRSERSAVTRANVQNIAAPITDCSKSPRSGMEWSFTDRNSPYTPYHRGIDERDIGRKPSENNMHNTACAGREGGVHVPPVVGGIQRPDLAHHPAFQGREF